MASYLDELFLATVADATRTSKDDFVSAKYEDGRIEILSIPKPEQVAVFAFDIETPVCVAKCVNCHRTRETKPRWPGEIERKILCAQCRSPYIYSEGRRQ